MTVPPSELQAIVARLRAAGCVFAEEEATLLVAEAERRGASQRAPASEERTRRGSRPSAAEASTGAADELAALVARRVSGEPLEYVLGWAQFCGLRIAVEPGVFVPRRRTALLAREAVALLPASGVAVDLCCGSGAVGAVLAAAGAHVHAADIDPAAVRCARRNLARVYLGDLDAPLPPELRGRVAVLVANAPYVPTAAIATMPPEARDHEHRVALDGGPDGLDVARRVAAVAPGWLVPGGSLLIETSERQASVLAAVFAGHGLAPRIVRDDELDATAVVGARRCC